MALVYGNINTAVPLWINSSLNILALANQYKSCYKDQSSCFVVLLKVTCNFRVRIHCPNDSKLWLIRMLYYM